MKQGTYFWFDIEIPKSVLFYRPMIKEIQARGYKVLITTRGGDGYKELEELMQLYFPEDDVFSIGVFGGSSKKGKLIASIERQTGLLEFVSNYNILKLITLCSVDATRVAFGLGIEVINFYDIPLSDYNENFKKALPQARLTLPLSTKVFKPFVVPNNIFRRFSLDDDQIIDYQFIDPLIWLKDFKVDHVYAHSIIKKLFSDTSLPLIVLREEEYKASYVDKKFPILYEALEEIYNKSNANILIIPRYEVNYLKETFPFAHVLEEKIEIQHLLAVADLFIGGGGTINTEACYFGTPTISTRSFICHYDKFQIDSNLMFWVTTSQELVTKVQASLGKRNDDLAKKVFGAMTVDINYIVDNIIQTDKSL